MGDRSKTIDELFGTRVRELRIGRALTQAQVGALVNKGESTVRMWELNKSQPDIQTINLLADFFNVSVGFLTGNKNIEAKAPVTTQELFDLGFDKDKIAKLTPNDISNIRAYIKGILDGKQ